MSRRALAVVAAGLAGVAAACGGGSSGGGLGSGDDWSIEGALREIPDDGADQFEIYLADLRRADELLGLERPDDLSDFDAVLDDWLLPLTFPGELADGDRRDLPLWIHYGGQAPLIPERLDALQEYPDLIGWSVLDVDSFVDYRPTPPAPYLLVARGEFADDALEGLDEVAPDVVTVGEGDDLDVNPASMSPLDRVGRPVRLARDGDRIAVSLGTDVAEDWVEGAEPTLADDDELAAIASVLDDADAVYVTVSRADRSLDAGGPPQSPEVLEAQRELVVLKEEFDTVAVAWSVVDGDPRVLVAYVADDDDAADDLAEQLDEVYTNGRSLLTGEDIDELYGVDDLEITVDGAAVLVSYEPTEFWVHPFNGIVRRDTPFVHD